MSEEQPVESFGEFEELRGIVSDEIFKAIIKAPYRDAKDIARDSERQVARTLQVDTETAKKIHDWAVNQVSGGSVDTGGGRFVPGSIELTGGEAFVEGKVAVSHGGQFFPGDSN